VEALVVRHIIIMSAKYSRRPGKVRLCLLLLSVLAIAPVQAQVTNSWVGPSGRWSETSFRFLFFNLPRWSPALSGSYATNVLRFSNWGAGYNTTNDLGTFRLHGLVFNNASNSLVNLSGGALSFTNNGATLAFIRTINSGSPNIANNVILGSTLSLEGTGSGMVTLSGNISGVGGLVVGTTATFELSGAGTFTGSTAINAGTLNLRGTGSLGSTPSITLSGGTLALVGGAGNRINDAAAMIGNGGAFALNGLSESLGTFTLQSGTSINFGAGAATLAFADSSATSWNPGATLSLLNWTEGSDGLYFGGDASGLAGQLAQIQFINPGGYAAGTYGALLLGDGEIVPVPEPGIFGLLVMGGLGIFLLRCRA